MYTNKYDYQCINVIKIILTNTQEKVLLIQEPEINEWMPLHWGLPGGKPTQSESLLETYIRKVGTDIGLNVRLKGLFDIREIVADSKTILMFIVVAECNDTHVNGESKAYKWVDKQDITQMEVKEFTEFFNKDLLIKYFENNNNLIDISLINTHEYYKMQDNKDYIEWYESGKAK